VSFWNLFEAIRVFRQLGTAQAIAVFTNLFAGRLVGMEWAEALDTALADSLADQLQVMTRDEQHVIQAYVRHAADAEEFTRVLKERVFQQIPAGRRSILLHFLQEAEILHYGSTSIDTEQEAQLTTEQARQVFALGQASIIPAQGVFQRRLRDLIGERGL
jgi:5-methylcytosine-specific restriction enzyme B